MPGVNPLESMGKAAKSASYVLAGCSSRAKNALLHTVADLLETHRGDILSANREDCAAAQASGMDEGLLDRLLLTPQRISALAGDVRRVATLPDPVGQVLDGGQLDSGLSLVRRRTPLGVVAAIYEARPNVTVDTAVLCLKTGNAVILRGGKETRRSNEALVNILQKALEQHVLPGQAVQAVTDPDRALVSALLRLDRYVDMLIPRGGPGLHRLCREQSRIPVITGGIGVCHIFVDASADPEKSLDVFVNAKVQRPSVCNAVETALVHRDIAAVFLPRLAARLAAHGVTLHASAGALPWLEGAGNVTPSLPGEYDQEWLTLDLNVHVVADLEEALAHIREHGSGHSDAILTESMEQAECFVRSVDSAAVYVNASTRFTDGGQFNLGAEVAISTQKLHARGPMGLDALTTYKWIGVGNYSVRE